MSVKKVAVVGAGTMGEGITQVVATSGIAVTMIDIVPAKLEKAQVAIRQSVERLYRRGSLTEEQMGHVDGIKVSDILSAAADADIVIEAATEDPKLKANIFSELDANTDPDAILATNTSSISITQIAAATQRPDKVVGMHFFNPVPLMGLVEIIRGMLTSNETMSRLQSMPMTRPDSSPTVSCARC